MSLVGYARVSSVGQSLEVQLDKLKHCRKIFQEKKSVAGGKRLWGAAEIDWGATSGTEVATGGGRVNQRVDESLQLVEGECLLVFGDEEKRQSI